MADSPTNTILSRRMMLSGLEALAPAALVAPTAEAMKGADEHGEFLQAQFRKLLLSLGRAESERRITYWDYGKYAIDRTQKEKSDGRFVLDLSGDDHSTFLCLIAVGCVLSGH